LMAGTEIMTVADLTEMEARVDIGEVDIVLIALGQTARLDIDAFTDRKFTGKVTEIANSSKGSAQQNAQQGGGGQQQQQEATKFEVKIHVTDKGQFRPGMSVTAEIETRYRTNVLTAPIQSVTTRAPKAKEKKDEKEQSGGGGPEPGDQRKREKPSRPMEIVFLVDGNSVKKAPVKRGISDEEYVEIVEGLQEGQTVVSGGYKAINRELEEGKKVIVDNSPDEKKEKS
jgi:HlyD family secretion protein